LQLPFGRHVPEQQSVLAVHARPLGRQHVPPAPQVAPLVLQQSRESRHEEPTGPHAQVPPAQMPLQQSDDPEQSPPTEAQQRPFWQVAAQHSMVEAQDPPSGAQQLAPLQRRPGQQSVSPVQNRVAVEQHWPPDEQV
jgi:hypothetical protein